MSGHEEIIVKPAAKSWNKLREPRQGVMLHYDASSSDAGSLAWLTHPDIKCSYNFIVFDDGSWARIAPIARRAWHAGRCRPFTDSLEYGDANSAFYGLAIANSGGEEVTTAQLSTVIWLTKRLFVRHTWPYDESEYRVTTHSAEAWPRGRKIDPEGPDPANPLLTAGMVSDSMFYDGEGVEAL